MAAVGNSFLGRLRDIGITIYAIFAAASSWNSSKRLAPRGSICESASMSTRNSFQIALMAIAILMTASGADLSTKKSPTMAEVLGASKPSDWRMPDPENTIYLELTNGRVVIELAPAFAPNHVANIKALVREHYFDGLAFLRCQDNY